MSNKEVLVLLPDSPYSDWIIQRVELLDGVKFDFVCFGVERKYTKSLSCRFLLTGTKEYYGFFGSKIKYDRVVIHYHNFETAFFIERYKVISEKLVWILWSGDLYNTKFYRKPLYFNKNFSWKEAHCPASKPTNKVKEWVKSRLGRVNFYDYKKSFQRIKYIGTDFPHDVKEAEDTFGKSFNLIKHSILSINELFEVDTFATISSRGEKLLLGHSGALENNHLDAIDTLNTLEISHEILCPLSYGDKGYIKSVVSAGKNAFGEKFIPLTKFLPKYEYYNLLTEVGYAIFYLRVQQAFGNILGLLFLGVKIFLPKENSIFIDLRGKGFLLFSLDDMTQSTIATTLSKQDRLHNRGLILKFYNEQEVAEGYERIYLGSMREENGSI